MKNTASLQYDHFLGTFVRSSTSVQMKSPKGPAELSRHPLGNRWKLDRLPVGNTVVASMSDSATRKGKPSPVLKEPVMAGIQFRERLNMDTLVLTVSRQIFEKLEASASTIQIVKSLIWPFVARRSLMEVPFAEKEYWRFVNSMRKTAVSIQNAETPDNQEQSFCKYFLDSYLCKVFGDPVLPVRPDFVKQPLFSGWCSRFISRCIARRDVSFIYSLQKGAKLAWPALGKIKEREALEKHASRLLSPRPAVPDDVLQHIGAVSEEVFGEAVRTASRTNRWGKFLPSSSACFQRTSWQGGSLSLVTPYKLDLSCSDAKIMGKLPYLHASLNSWRQSTFDYCREEALSGFKKDKDGTIPALKVAVLTLPEPGKFRILTKGDGFLYSALQPFQGVLLNAWKKHEASTMTIDIDKRVAEIDEKAPELPFWCSVDYEAATDLLAKEASLEVLKELESNSLQYLLAEASLGPGLAYYKVDGKSYGVRFNEGQLMGHPLSFPLLCTINLAVFRAAVARWVSSKLLDKSYMRSSDSKDPDTKLLPHGREASMYKGPTLLDNPVWKTAALMLETLLCNGDDMMFKCTQDFYQIFLDTAKFVGFKTSQGKNYMSRDCCMMNSCVYRRVNGKMKRFGYLNQRIITGHNIKAGRSSATPTSLGKDVNEMIKNCPWAACSIPRVFSRFSQKWLGRYRPNWFLPVHLGGFGVDPLHGSPHFKVTKSQRELAARFMDNPKLSLCRVKGLDIPTAKLTNALAHWDMLPAGEGSLLDKFPDLVNTPEYNSDISDAWLERLAYAGFAAHGQECVDARVMFAKLDRIHGEKPRYISEEELKLYWKVKFLAHQLPVCPPMGPIRC